MIVKSLLCDLLSLSDPLIFVRLYEKNSIQSIREEREAESSCTVMKWGGGGRPERRGFKKCKFFPIKIQQ